MASRALVPSAGAAHSVAMELGPVLLLLSAQAVYADNDCLWYIDKQGNWHSGVDCPFFQFCCGNCTSRYCCLNPMQLISERQQNYCMSLNLSFTTIAGIVSAVLLLIVIIGILVCCFLCSCCYLYQRRHQMRQPVSGGREAIHSFPMQPTNPPNVSPGAYTSYQTAPAYGVAGAQGMFPNYPIQAGYPAYMPPASHAPYTSAPAYNAAPAPPYPSS
ncbi:protein shisa-4 isoform X2 [Mustelus asterias]